MKQKITTVLLITFIMSIGMMVVIDSVTEASPLHPGNLVDIYLTCCGMVNACCVSNCSDIEGDTPKGYITIAKQYERCINECKSEVRFVCEAYGVPSN